MKNDSSRLAKKVERKAESRQKKKKIRMRVSGKSVFKLREIMSARDKK